MSVDIATYVHDLAVAAKAASASLATASDEQRQEAVRAMAAALRNGVDSIVAAHFSRIYAFNTCRRGFNCNLS